MALHKLLEYQLCDCCQNNDHINFNNLIDNPTEFKPITPLQCSFCQRIENYPRQCYQCLSLICSTCILQSIHCASGCSTVFCHNCSGNKCQKCQLEYCLECFNPDQRCNKHCRSCSIKKIKNTICSKCNKNDKICIQCCYYTVDKKIYCTPCWYQNISIQI